MTLLFMSDLKTACINLTVFIFHQSHVSWTRVFLNSNIYIRSIHVSFKARFLVNSLNYVALTYFDGGIQRYKTTFSDRFLSCVSQNISLRAFVAKNKSLSWCLYTTEDRIFKRNWNLLKFVMKVIGYFEFHNKILIRFI